MELNVNNDIAIQFTAKLEKLHRSAFPSAVRNTLNEVAFNAKKLVPQKANENFTIRQKNLFTRMTLVQKASGFNVSGMSSKIGIDGTKGSLSEGLEKQETGGVITGRKLIAHDMARTSSSNKKKVKGKNYLKNINLKNKGSKYVRIKKGAKDTIFEVNKNKLTPIYTVRKSKNTEIKQKPFINPSAIEASKGLIEIYKKQSEFQFKKYLK